MAASMSDFKSANITEPQWLAFQDHVFHNYRDADELNQKSVDARKAQGSNDERIRGISPLPKTR
jgi:hypothetical protein